MAKKSRATYIPNKNIQSLNVKNGKRVTEIKNKDILDGAYVRKGVKFANGGALSSDDEDTFSNVFTAFGFVPRKSFAGVKFYVNKKHKVDGKIIYGSVDLKNKRVIVENEDSKTYYDSFSISELIKTLEKLGFDKKYANGGSMKVGDKKVYNKLVGRKGNEYYFLDYIFKHDEDFMGATGTIVTPVDSNYFEYATSRDGLAERYLDAMSESEWCNTLGLDEDDCTEEEIIDGIENLYIAGELQPFEECSSKEESQMREIAEFSDSNKYPLFEVIGGGRSFDADQKFDEVYDKTLLALIIKAESKKLANGGGVGELEIGNEVELELNNGKTIKGKVEKINPLKIRTDASSTQVIPNALIKNIKKYAKGGSVGKDKLKEFEIFKNGTQQGTVMAKNLKEAKDKVFAAYGEHREVYEVDTYAKGGGFMDNTGLGITNEHLIGRRTQFIAFVDEEKRSEAISKIKNLFSDAYITDDVYYDNLRNQNELEITIIPNFQSTLSLKSTNDKLENLKYIGLIRSFTTSFRQYAKGGSIKKGDLVRVKKHGWVMLVEDIKGDMYMLENSKSGYEISGKSGNAGGYLFSDIEKVEKMAKGGGISIYQTEQEAFDINEPSFQRFLKINNIEFSPVGGAVRGDYHSYMFYGTKPTLKKMLMKYWLMDESLEDANRLAEEQIEEETYAKGGGVKGKKTLQQMVDHINNTYEGVVASKTYNDNRIQVVSPYFNTLSEIKRKEFSNNALMEKYGNTSQYVLYSNSVFEQGGNMNDDKSYICTYEIGGL